MIRCQTALARQGRRFFLFSVVVIVTGCASTGDPLGGEESGEASIQPITFFAPATTEQLPTTDGAVFMGNLHGRIDVITPRFQARPSAVLGLRLVDELLQRYRIVGHEDDLQRARDALARIAATGRQTGPVALRQARMLALHHQFDEALGKLTVAAQQGVSADARLGLEREIALGQGRYEDARRLTGQMTGDPLIRLAAEGNLLIDEGQLEAAARRFDQAQRAYRGVNPLVVAWLFVQHGVLHLRHGDARQAQAFFEAAHERLPDYYLATEHLAETSAELGQLDRASQLYARVVDQTDNPQFIAAWADVERQRGHTRDARRLDDMAASRFEEVLKREPAAHWGHAVEFFLARDPERAMTMATANAAARGDIGSLILLAETALAADQPERACEAWRQASETGLNPPELTRLSADVATQCK